MDELKELLPLLVRRLNDRETDSSSSEDDLDLHILKRFQTVQQHLKITKRLDYMQRVDQYSDTEFKEQFRYLQKFMLNGYRPSDSCSLLFSILPLSSFKPAAAGTYLRSI